MNWQRIVWVDDDDDMLDDLLIAIRILDEKGAPFTKLQAHLSDQGLKTLSMPASTFPSQKYVTGKLVVRLKSRRKAWVEEISHHHTVLGIGRHC